MVDMQLKSKEEIFKQFVGKKCKIVLNANPKPMIYYGEVVWLNESYLIERSLKDGRLSFINMDLILEIKELPENTKNSKETVK